MTDDLLIIIDPQSTGLETEEEFLIRRGWTKHTEWSWRKEFPGAVFHVDPSEARNIEVTRSGLKTCSLFPHLPQGTPGNISTLSAICLHSS